MSDVDDRAVVIMRGSRVMDQPGQQPDPAARPRRPTFTVEKKLALLVEYDAATP